MDDRSWCSESPCIAFPRRVLQVFFLLLLSLTITNRLGLCASTIVYSEAVSTHLLVQRNPIDFSISSQVILGDKTAISCDKSTVSVAVGPVRITLQNHSDLHGLSSVKNTGQKAADFCIHIQPILEIQSKTCLNSPRPERSGGRAPKNRSTNDFPGTS